MRVARTILIGLGVAGLAWGVFVLLSDVALGRIPGVALWIGAAIVLHDGIVAPIVFALGVLIRRAGKRVSGTIVVVIEGAIVVGSIMSLIVVLAIVAQPYAPENPSLLPFDYGMRLGIFWLVLAALVLGLSLWLYASTRRANHRLPAGQS